MNSFIDTLLHLLPEGGWSVQDNDFNRIVYDEGVTPISKEVFDETMENIEAIKTSEIANKAAAKAALLAQLGITEEQARLLLS